MLELEGVGVRKYYVDAENSSTYQGHFLLNMRGEYTFNNNLVMNARVLNISNRKHSTYSSRSVGGGDVTHRPGSPRAFYMGVKKTW